MIPSKSSNIGESRLINKYSLESFFLFDQRFVIKLTQAVKRYQNFRPMESSVFQNINPLSLSKLEEEFRSFLVNSTKIHHEIENASNSNQPSFFLDLDDLQDNKELYFSLHKNFVNNYQNLDKIFKDFCVGLDCVPMDLSFKNPLIHSKLRDLKSCNLGNLVSFRGTVTRTTQVRPELSLGAFKCKDCGTLISGVKQEFVFTEPLYCQNHLCSNRSKFEVDLNESKFINWQRVHVQESTEEIPNGCLPRSLDVIIRNELCEQIKPGQTLKFTGYLVVIPDTIQLKLPNQKSIPTAQGVAEEKSTRNVNSKELNYRFCFYGINADVFIEQKNFTNEELQVIHKIQMTPNLYENLYESLFPSIHGHSNIKSAILLMLVGGVSKIKDINLRGDINVLLVGDPGTAKSQFLKQTSSLNPRSIYTSGKSSSAAGLTAAVIKDKETGEFTIEAGALMLADQGVCCIDEFDKMTYKDQVSIHEAMEQQTITIAKAGINATLNSRTSILAAANPIRGRYDRRKTLKQNVNLSAPIMSRFDLYFVLIDQVDADHDRNVSRHILHNHFIYNNTEIIPEKAMPFTVDEVTLYIKYIKDKTPVLTDQSKKEIISKYISLRQDSLVNTNNYRMTVRHLESLIRLGEALAKIHNDKDIKSAYILEAYRLIKSSLIELKSEDFVMTCQDSGENVTISTKDFSKITNSLIYILKSNEAMSKIELVSRYLEFIENTIENTEMLRDETDKVERCIEFLIFNEGVLYDLNGTIQIHPDYDY